MLKGGCRVGFFGLGSSNAALLDCLPLEKCRITIRCDRAIDLSKIPTGLRVERILSGKESCLDIDEDIIFFSPSVRRDRAELVRARERGVIFSSDAELFFEENKAPAIAVTGSDGKSTTATLIDLLLTAGGKKSTLIGNIGEAMTQNLGNGSDFFVCELSSFMLTYLTPKVKAACITNITPNHLDWHKDYKEYRETKLSIAKNAERLIISDENTDIIGAYGIISAERSLKELKSLYKAELYMTIEDGYICRSGERLIEISGVERKERHNLKNLMMAIAMTDGLVGQTEICEVARNFGGLRHRCEVVLSRGGVDYIDSSIDSTPARTAQTLLSLDRSVVIILGGRGKGLEYRELIPTLKKYAKKIVITGENAEEIYSAVKGELDAEMICGFEEAVIYGRECAESVGALLLSPASTSYDRFKNYAERGEVFKQILLKNP